MSASAIKAGQAYVEISARDKALRDSLEANKKRMQSFVKGVAIIGAGAALAAAASSIKAASDLEETLNKFNVVFGNNRDAMKQWGDEFAAQVGRSQRQVAEFLANTQDLLIPVGFEQGAAEQMSQEITQLAVDVASFNNKLDSDVLRDFHSALTGGGETVKKYGVVLDVAATKAKLLNAGIDPSTASNAQKTWARWQIILDSTTAAQGDAIRSSDSYANQMKRLEGQMEDLAGSLGSALLPAITEFVQLINSVVGPMAEWVSENQEFVQTLLAMAGGLATALGIIKAVNIALSAYAAKAVIAQSLSGPAGWVALAAGLGVAAAAITQLNKELEATNEKIAAVTPKLEGLGDAAKKVANAQDWLAENSTQISELMDKERTSAEKLADSLDVLAERQWILNRERKGGRKLRDDDFVPAELNQLRDRLIDSATGWKAELQKAKDELAKINGELTDSQIKLRDMAAKGLPVKELKELEAALAALDAGRQKQKDKQAADLAREQKREDVARQRQEEFDRLQAGADEIKNAMLSPAELLAKRIEDMRAMIKAGVLERETANAFVMKQLTARDRQHQQQTLAFMKSNSSDVRSSSGASAIAALLNGNKGLEQRKLRAAQATAKATKAMKQKLDELEVAEV